MRNFANAVLIIGAGVVAGCGGSAVAPAKAALHGAYGRVDAVILPDRRAKTKTFDYIINDYGTYASIFDYPNSDKQIGTIKNVGGQGCTNVLYG